METKKILIIGAGIAGVTIARELAKRQIDFKVIDTGVNYSSRIAAGLINPMVFRRMAKSWRVDEFLPFARSFYEDASKEWGSRYFHPIPIRRAFAHQQEYDFWVKKQEIEEYKTYLKALTPEDHHNQSVINTFGTGEVLNAAYISTKEFLDDAFIWLKQTGRLTTHKVAYANIDPERCTYKGETFTEIIFCEGFHGLENPWFNYLPLQATKGETLSIQSTEISQQESLNRKCFVLPLGNGNFKVGATYSWDNPTLNTTAEAREELTTQLTQLTTGNFEVVDQEAGVRPTVLDRRPFLGRHPIHSSLVLFNGLGTKGYLMAPLLAAELAAYLFDASRLDKEVDIQRYKKRFL
jgi:glycine/D-amino acid oxidase-like deaminating enzyme